VVIRPFYEVVDELRERLRVEKQEGRSRLVEVRYRHRDPRLAADVVNVAVNTFVEYRRTTGTSELRNRVEILREQVSRYRMQLADAEEQLRAYREQHRIVAPEEQATQQVRLLAEVQSGREAAVIERRALMAELAQLGQGAGGEVDSSQYRKLAAFPSFIANQGVQSILESLITLEEERSALLLLRTPENADVRRVQGRIAELERQLHRLATDYVRSLESQIASADATLARFGGEMESVPGRELEFARLKREQLLLNEVYLGLQARLKDAEVQYASLPDEVRVVDFGLAAEDPVWPRPLVMLILASMLGAMVGVVLAVGRDVLDGSVRSQEDVERVSAGVPVIGLIPHTGSARDPLGWRRRLSWRWLKQPLLRGPGAEGSGTGLVLRDQPHHSASEAFRALRTSLTAAGGGAVPEVIVITSPCAGDGKSTSCANLAIALVQQGHRVLLVDGDLRRGTLHRVLGAQPTPGLAQLLQGTHETPDAVQELEMNGSRSPALHFVARGNPPPQPGELLGGDEMLGFLNQVRGQYDRIIIDTPALENAADGVVLGGLADAVLLVVRAGATDREVVARVTTRLQRLRIPVDGIVLNDVEPSSSGTYSPLLAEV
jgi:capsular exopolysaccharide synthesis family protein